mgnify:CR=1 FL=1
MIISVLEWLGEIDDKLLYLYNIIQDKYYNCTWDYSSSNPILAQSWILQTSWLLLENHNFTASVGPWNSLIKSLYHR